MAKSSDKSKIRAEKFSRPSVTNRRQKQAEFNFQSHAKKDGLASWYQEREEMLRDLATKLGLPIGHRAEVRLKDGVILSGNLRAGEVVLSPEKFSRGKLALEVDGFVFTYSEMESCVRLD